MWPPPRTIKKCPRVHRWRVFFCPVSLLQLGLLIGSSLSSCSERSALPMIISDIPTATVCITCTSSEPDRLCFSVDNVYLGNQMQCQLASLLQNLMKCLQVCLQIKNVTYIGYCIYSYHGIIAITYSYISHYSFDRIILGQQITNRQYTHECTIITNA